LLNQTYSAVVIESLYMYSNIYLIYTNQSINTNTEDVGFVS
jgi:hypothetical protein